MIEFLSHFSGCRDRLLSQNIPKEFKTILAACLAHIRCKFVDVAWNFPDECSYVIETPAKVYRNDKVVRMQNILYFGRK